MKHMHLNRSILERLAVGLVTFSAALLTLVAPAAVAAAPPSSTATNSKAKTNRVRGITVTPYLQSISIAGFEPNKSFNVQVTNQTRSSRKFDVSISDFGPSDELGGVAFLSGGNDYISQHGLSNWLSVTPSSFMLQSGKSITLTATIRNDTSLLPGGHYGAILVNEESRTPTSKSSTIKTNEAVASLVFATKVGGEQYDLRLDKVQVDKSLLHLPQTINLRFQNPGNVAVVPRGTVQLLNDHGSVVAQAAINEESAIVLPGAYRQLYVSTTSLQPVGWWPQHYTVRVNYRYDGITRTAQYTTRLYFLNLPHIVRLAAVVVVLALGSWKMYQTRLWKSLPKLHRQG